MASSSKHRLAAWVRDKIRLATTLILIPLVCSFFASAHWVLELTSHFQAHYFSALLICLVALAAFRDWRWSGIAAAAAVISGASVVPWYFRKPPVPEPAAGLPLRLLLSNVHTANRNSDGLLGLAKSERIDVAVLQEVDGWWLQELEPLREVLPEGKAIPREDNFGIGIWSRLPLANLREMELGPFGVPTIVAECAIGTQKVLIVATHPVPPASAEGAAARDAQLNEVAQIIRESPKPVVLIGDLNVTMWAPAYRRLVETTGLRDVRQGFGILPTWPAPFSSLGIPLDHCLVSEGLRVRAARAGRPIGSDHLPLLVELIVPPAE